MNFAEIKRCDTHSHSCYSNIRLLDSINKIDDMVLRAAELGLKGLALTDHECLCGHVDFLNAEVKYKEEKKIPEDFKCMLGNEIYLIPSRENYTRFFHFILIAKNDMGHRALRELSSTAWYNGFTTRGMERVPTTYQELEETVKKYPNSLIATTACIGGQLGNLVLELCKFNESKEENEDNIRQKKKEIIEFLRFCVGLFGNDFYIEIAPGCSKDQITFNKKVKDIAKDLGIKMIFADDSHYLKKEDRFVHKAYLTSKNGEREVDDFYSYAYMMSTEEAFENLYPYYNEKEFLEMCENSMEIYNKVEGYNLFRKSIIPRVKVEEVEFNVAFLSDKYPTLDWIVREGDLQAKNWLKKCIDGLDKKGKFNEIYLERLETEADVIKTIGDKLETSLFAYFVTFVHYIDLFWECGSIVGPGRGSAVGFLSNYLLGITQIDPIKNDLNYWRFLNKERVELADIDVDLSPTKRGKIFKKIREERGEKNLLQVCTFGSEGTRSAIQTACRGYRSSVFPEGIDSDIALYLSGLIPQERGFLWPIKDVVEGNEELDRKPVKAFIDEVKQYPGLLDIIMSIEGLVNKRGQHASGVILYNETPYETNAIMRSPNGDLVTQFDLHRSEQLGDVKFDFLVTEVCDKIITCINLLQQDGYFDDCENLREIYNKYFHPEIINLEDKRIWDALESGDVLDVFQFNSTVGLQSAKTIKPTNPLDMCAANSLMRLMGEKGKERPIDRYARLKNNMDEWYKEVRAAGLTEEEIKCLEPYYLPRCGTPCMQEDLMRVVMDPNISNFTLKESNEARKIVAKKQMKKIPELKEKFFKQCKNSRIAEYVWETVMAPQMGYAFSVLHSLAYSYVGIQTLILATNYPRVYWNCACLIVNSGGLDDEEEEYEDIDVEEEDDDEDDKKKKNTSIKYGKIAAAIGQMQSMGIRIMMPDINKSQFTFTPNLEENAIVCGLKGISRIGSELINTIIDNRPYNGLEDFIKRIKVNKPQVVNLIKCGAFDSFGDRYELMKKYIESISDKKVTLNLRNMQMLMRMDLLPDELILEGKIFNYNKALKAKVSEDGLWYLMDERQLEFYEKNFDTDLIDYSHYRIKVKDWDKIYKKSMDKVRDWIKENLNELLIKVNSNGFEANWEKYAKGSISKWEMQSISCYFHEHELHNIDKAKYGITDYFELPENPVIERFVPMQGRTIPMYKLSHIAGTVVDKDKNKSQIQLLTETGVVTVKIYQVQFAKYDRQISEKQADGKKKVIEKSWLSRGNKLLLMGIRRDNTFVLKKYKNSKGEVLSLIEEVEPHGQLKLRTERAKI